MDVTFGISRRTPYKSRTFHTRYFQRKGNYDEMGKGNLKMAFGVRLRDFVGFVEFCPTWPLVWFLLPDGFFVGRFLFFKKRNIRK